MSKIKIALIGAGYWGPNLARNIAQSPGAVFAGICDRDGDRAAQMAATYAPAFADTDLASTLTRTDVDAVVLATPSGLHFEQAKAALTAGKHVMVEKPLAHTAAEALELDLLAKSRGLILMVGHTFLYNNIVHDVKRRIDAGDLGEPLYVYAQRLNLGRFRTNSDVVWTLAPHDISIINFWFGARPTRVSSRGHAFVHPRANVAEVAFVHFEYPRREGRASALVLA